MIRITGPVLDASTPISREKARAMREAGYLGVIRAFGFVNTKWAEPTREELEGLRAEGLAVALYASFRFEGHNADTGRADAARWLALLDALDPEKVIPAWVDLECEVTPTAADARAYAEVLSNAFRFAGRPALAYVDATFARTKANVAGLFQEWWRSGSNPEQVPGFWTPAEWVLKQSKTTTVAGHPVDLNEADGAPFAPPVKVAPVKYPSRAIVPNESEADRYCRQLEAICDAGHTTKLLERGVSLAQSTCQIVARAAENHARRDTDDDTIVREKLPQGRTIDWGDYGAEVAQGDNLIDVGITYPAQARGAWCGQGDPGYKDGPTRGCTYWIYTPGVTNSEHVSTCMDVLSDITTAKDRTLTLYTIQGGQGADPKDKTKNLHVQRFKDSKLVWDGKVWKAGAKTVKGWQVRRTDVIAGHGAWPYPDSIQSVDTSAEAQTDRIAQEDVPTLPRVPVVDPVHESGPAHETEPSVPELEAPPIPEEKREGVGALLLAVFGGIVALGYVLADCFR